MCKLLVLITGLLSFNIAYSQLAIVNDKDGYSNIRSEPGNDAPVIDTIANGRIVYHFEEGDKNWLQVGYTKKNEERMGYIHRSRVIFLQSFRKFSVTVSNDTVIIFRLDSLEIMLAATRYSHQGRMVKYDQSGKWVSSIDGKRPWGTDGELPRRQYQFIRGHIGKKVINIDKKYWTDIFEPNFHLTNVFLDPGTRKIYIAATNGDGAGGYLVVWVVSNESVEAREVLAPF